MYNISQKTINKTVDFLNALKTSIEKNPLLDITKIRKEYKTTGTLMTTACRLGYFTCIKKCFYSCSLLPHEKFEPRHARLTIESYYTEKDRSRKLKESLHAEDGSDKTFSIKETIADIEKEKSPSKKRFTPPTLEEVQAYCGERNNNINAKAWMDHYIANGWMLGKTKMVDWKAAIRKWEFNSFSSQPTLFSPEVLSSADLLKEYDARELDKLRPDEYFTGHLTKRGWTGTMERRDSKDF